MKNVFTIISLLMLTIFSSMAQNSVVDKFTDATQPRGSKHAHIVLYPNKSIKENYAKIQSLMDLHEERKYAEYTIVVQGYYTSKKGKYLDDCMYFINIKGKDNERFYTVSGQIIRALVELYAQSLDVPFNCDRSDYFIHYVNERKYKRPSGREYKNKNGEIVKEYITVTDSQNNLYHLYSTSSLYKKIYQEVINETGLKDGGSSYKLERRLLTTE